MLPRGDVFAAAVGAHTGTPKVAVCVGRSVVLSDGAHSTRLDSDAMAVCFALADEPIIGLRNGSVIRLRPRQTIASAPGAVTALLRLSQTEIVAAWTSGAVCTAPQRRVTPRHS